METTHPQQLKKAAPARPAVTRAGAQSPPKRGRERQTSDAVCQRMSGGLPTLAAAYHRPVDVGAERLDIDHGGGFALNVDRQLLADGFQAIGDVCEVLPGSPATLSETLTLGHRHLHEECFEVHSLKITERLPAVKRNSNCSGNFHPEGSMVKCAMDVKTARMLNLRHIIATEFDGIAGHCADELGIKRPQIHRWITPEEESRQGISEESARKIEAKLGKPHGSLDAPPGGIGATSDDDAKVIAEFAWIYQNATDEGREFLCKSIKAASKAYLKEERRTNNVQVIDDRRNK